MLFKIIQIIFLILLCLFIIVLIKKKKNINEEAERDTFIELKTDFYPKRKNLLFTSAGDNTEFYKYWCDSNRNYDIFLIYYKNDDKIFESYKKYVDIALKRKGYKYPNFRFFYNKYKQLILKYDNVFILDDDIIISTKDINEMFTISKKYDLWVCQPSFDKNGQNSHSINVHQPNTILRFTNFIEEGVPLFNKYGLITFMNEYTKPVYKHMYAKSIDYLICNTLDIENNNNKIAVVDCIISKNPPVDEKKLYDKNKNKTKNREFQNLVLNDLYLNIDKLFYEHKIPKNVNKKIYSFIKK